MADVVSPLPGVFYRSPGPDKAPFVDVGDQVESGQAIGIIEVMKQFTEIRAHVSGTVSSLPIADNAMVNPGDVLAVIDEA